MASKRRLRRRSCTGKRRFDSQQKAGGVAGFLARRNCCRMNTYRCRFCNGWHVGHHSRKGQRQKAEPVQWEGRR